MFLKDCATVMKLLAVLCEVFFSGFLSNARNGDTPGDSSSHSPACPHMDIGASKGFPQQTGDSQKLNKEGGTWMLILVWLILQILPT